MKSARKILWYVAMVIFVIVVSDVSLVLGFGSQRPEIEHADAVIVLGAAIGSPAAYNRALEAVRLIEAGKTETVVVAGGKVASRDQSEAVYMEKVISAKSTKEPDVILEDQSHTTYENISNARKKIPEAKSVIIVSDEFHLARGVLLAKRAGFEKVYWSSPAPTYYSKTELRRYYFREIIAMLSYIPKFIFG